MGNKYKLVGFQLRTIIRIFEALERELNYLYQYRFMLIDPANLVNEALKVCRDIQSSLWIVHAALIEFSGDSPEEIISDRGISKWNELESLLVKLNIKLIELTLWEKDQDNYSEIGQHAITLYDIFSGLIKAIGSMSSNLQDSKFKSILTHSGFGG